MIYIFKKIKEKKCHTEMVCGVVKGATVQAKASKMNRLIENSKKESSDL